MLTQQDLLFLCTVLGLGHDSRRLIDACADCARQPDLDLPATLLQQHLLTQQQVDQALQALQDCLERNDWRKESALEELIRLAGPARLEECWQAATALAGRVDPADPHLDRYRDRHLHAEGGLGRVWQARDQRMGRVVALKDLRPQLADRQPILLRFVQEARITSQLEHPNIVPVYDLHDGATGNSPFYTMKFISGRTLQDALEQFHRQPPPQRWASVEFHKLLFTFAQVCEAIAYAHSRGIIHRDLKPANVALGDFNAVMVIDWGLARRIDEADSVADELPVEDRLDRTRAGDVLGTPAYMAPEQAKGTQDQIGPATDVYGLGAMLFAILTGEPPRPALDGEQAADYLKRIAVASTPCALTIRPDLPEPLNAICAQAMAPRPNERYLAAADLAADIQRWLAGQAVAAYPERWHQRLGRWLKQHPAWTQAVASIVLLLVVTASVVITNSWAAEQTLDLVGRANLEQEARSLAEIYQARLSDFPARVQFFAQMPILSASLRDAKLRDQPALRQRVEDMIHTAIHLRPEYLEIGVLRPTPWTWLIQLNRDQPGEAKLRVVADQAVTSPSLLKFLNDCEPLTEGQAHCAIIPPSQVGVSARLWVGVKTDASRKSNSGLVVLVVDLQRLLQTPETTGLGGGYVHMVDGAGTILTKPIAGEARPAVGRIEKHNPALAAYFATRPLPAAGIFASDDEPAQLTACRRLTLESIPNPLDLVLVVERPLDAEAEQSARAYRLVMGLTALVILAALALTYGLVRLLAGGLAVSSR